jgi:hypothetical protein
VPALILEVFQASPDALLFVIPNLSGELRSAEPSLRCQAVTLIADMFSSRGGKKLASEYRELFGNFLARAEDVDPRVRITLLEALPRVLRAATEAASIAGMTTAVADDVVADVVAVLSRRLLDQDERVRRSVVAVIVRVSRECAAVPVELLTDAAARLADRKPAVRQATLVALVDAFKAAQRRSGAEISRWPDADARRYAWIPDRILSLYPLITYESHAQLYLEFRRCLVGSKSVLATGGALGAPLSAEALRAAATGKGGASSGSGAMAAAPGSPSSSAASSVTAGKVAPPSPAGSASSNGSNSSGSSSSGTGANSAAAVISVYRSLTSPKSRGIFARCLEYSWFIRRHLDAVLAARRDQRAHPDSQRHKDHLAKTVAALAERLVDPPRAKEVLTRMIAAKEIFVIRALAGIAAEETPAAERVRMASQLAARFGNAASAHATRAVLGLVNRYPFDATFAGHALESASSLLEYGDTVGAREVLALLETVARYAPKVLNKHYAALHALCATDDAEALSSALRILASTGAGLRDAAPRVATKLRAELIDLATVDSDSPRVAKCAARAFLAVFGADSVDAVALRDAVLDRVRLCSAPARVAVLYAALTAVIRGSAALAGDARVSQAVDSVFAKFSALGGASGGGGSGGGNESTGAGAGTASSSSSSSASSAAGSLTRPASGTSSSSSSSSRSKRTVASSRRMSVAVPDDAEMRARGFKLIAAALAARAENAVSTAAANAAEGTPVPSAAAVLRADPITPRFLGLLTSVLTDAAAASAAASSGSAAVAAAGGPSMISGPGRRHLQIAATTAFLRMLAVPGWDHEVSPTTYAAVVSVATSPDVSVRRGLLARLTKRHKMLRARYLAIFALYACDEERDLAAQAKAALAAGVKVCRTAADRARLSDPRAAAAAAAASKSSSSSSKSAAAAAATAAAAAAAGKEDDAAAAHAASVRSFPLLPENGLPYLIHTLAHQSGYEADQPTFRNASRVLAMYIDAVLSGSDTFAFLQQVLVSVRYAEDATAPTSKRTATLAGVGLHLVKRRSENRAWKLQAFPGTILLPVALYRRARGGTTAPAGDGAAGGGGGGVSAGAGDSLLAGADDLPQEFVEDQLPRGSPERLVSPRRRTAAATKRGRATTTSTAVPLTVSGGGVSDDEGARPSKRTSGGSSKSNNNNSNNSSKNSGAARRRGRATRSSDSGGGNNDDDAASSSSSSSFRPPQAGRGGRPLASSPAVENSSAPRATKRARGGAKPRGLREIVNEAPAAPAAAPSGRSTRASRR